MQENSQAVLVATGALPALILVAAILTLPVCLALLALYRRAVLAGMLLSCVGDIALMLPVRVFTKYSRIR